MTKTSPSNSTVSLSELATLTNLTPRRLRQLATEKRIPGGTKAGWPLNENVRALFHFYQTSGEEYGRERTLKLSAQRRRIELQLAKEQRAVIDKGEVAAAIGRILPQAVNILEAKLINEYPSAVAGLDVPQARVYGRRLYDEVMVAFKKLSKEFPE